MLKLIKETTYTCDDLTITVAGLNCEQLSNILPICSNLTKKLNAKVLELSKDEELSQILQKRSEDKELTSAEKIRIFEFNNSGEDFSLDAAQVLAENYMGNIVKVTTGDNDVTTDYKAAVLESPKHLKALANLIYAEYKDATEVSSVKKT